MFKMGDIIRIKNHHYWGNQRGKILGIDIYDGVSYYRVIIPYYNEIREFTAEYIELLGEEK